MLGRWNIAGAWHGSLGAYLVLATLSGTFAVAGAWNLFERVVRSAETALRAEQGATPLRAATLTGVEPRSNAAANAEELAERTRSREQWLRLEAAGPAAFIRKEPTASGSGPFTTGGNWDGTYRAVCVRLCDGYYWPINASTTEDNFKREQQLCSNSCSQPARLYVRKNTDGEAGEIQTVDGQPYSLLKTAYLYRTKYDSNCKCRAEPWDGEARNRHRLYALEERRRKGDKAAAKEAEALMAQMAAERRARLLAQAGGNSATIVAATQATDLIETRTLAPAVPKAPARQAATRQAASGGSGPGGMMRVGAGSSGSSSRTTGWSAPSSASSAGWRNEAFKGN